MKWFFILFVFLAVLIGHFFYVTQSVNTSNGDSPWASYRLEQPQESRLNRYIGQSEYWLGLSLWSCRSICSILLYAGNQITSGITCRICRRTCFRRSPLGGYLFFGRLLWVAYAAYLFRTFRSAVS